MATNIRQTLFIGIKGTVIAIDRTSGGELWRTRLKGSGFTNVVLDGDRVLVSVQGQLYCLDASTGQVLWHNPLKGMGYGLCTIAGGSILPMAQQMADEEAAAASTAVIASA